jgi:drug/metabolite transporter (DMT)-like permease
MEEKQFSGFAIAGFVLSFFWIFLIPSILAIIFSAIGLHRTLKGERQGKGLAIAGLVMGIIGTSLFVLYTGALMSLI